MQTWRAAWGEALYGPAGFSVTGDRGPRHDFSTSVTRGPALAGALARLLTRLHLPAGYDVVDVGAGDGRLITDLRAALDPAVAARGRFVAVELAPRPAALPASIEWVATPPATVTGLLIAHELLDTVPCTVAEVDAAGVLRQVCVDRAGGEQLGGPVSPADAAWLQRWWPLTHPGERADVGRERDEIWLRLAGSVDGVAIAIDYGHLRGSRPVGSTLTGWSRGRRVPPRPDGDCDLTAHVAMDSCVQPGDRLLTQRAALAELWSAETEPAASRDRLPRAGLTALAGAAERRALLDPDGLGGYLWLIHRSTARRPRETGA